MSTKKAWEVYEANFIKSATKPAQYPQPALPEIAFAGRSNVGKSSLLNNLVRRKNLAKTSAKPGHTQLINFFHINNRCYYVDLPGYGYAKAPLAEKEKWRLMIEAYLRDNTRLQLLILLLDVRREPSDMDDQMVAYAEATELPVMPVLTKCDKLKRGALKKAQIEIGRHYGLTDPEHLPLISSAQSGLGRDSILQEIHAALLDAEEETQE